MAKLNLSQLRTAGVVSRAPVKREVTWTHVNDAGESVADTFDVWVLPSTLGSELAIHKEVEKDREYILTALSKKVQLEDEKGKKISLPYDEWAAFDPFLAMAIFKVAQEVTTVPKALAPLTNCSVNSSPVASGAAP